MHVGIVVFKLEDVAQVRPAPTVDRLVRIAGDRQIWVVHRERTDDGILCQVGVLILVDQDITVARIEQRAHLRAFTQQHRHVEEHVVEIDGVGL